MLTENRDTEPTAIDSLMFEKLVFPEHSLGRVKQLIDCERFWNLVVACSTP